ncbi:ABC transporter ATP-binding protein [Mobiluncus porci]|uniref:ABC transporter ATP-binding protein n=1 Tax=Mobiluncus porci TaxID=2652278 RepID=A0A7K0K635_9ACTO|nr:ABC transporter ATP-binding protein [Mobiluncus porci]MST50520.1 ABC transporter ATP-binding protein [Mobiluncus porci]
MDFAVEPLRVSLERVEFQYGVGETNGEAAASGATGSKTGSKRVILAETSLEIPAGLCVVITGPSGGGKTTLVRLLNGLIPHFYSGILTGEIRLAVDTASGESRDETLHPSTAPLWKTGGRVATVFQNPRTQFFTTDTTSEMAFGLENAGASPDLIAQRVNAVAESLGVSGLLGQSLFALSGGQKQLVATAGAAVGSPGLYLFDEPTSNLSAASISRFSEVLRELKARGATIVIAEHRLYFLRELADRVILVDGEIREDWEGSEFFSLPEERIRGLGLRTLLEPQIETPKMSQKARPHDSLTLADVEVAYGKRVLLKIDKLVFPRGRVIGVTGSNGIGKSSLAAVLTGLKKAARGTITLDGERLGRKARTRASYLVMQDVNRQLFTDSALAELRLGNEVSAERAREILDEYDLGEYAEAHPLALSGGQKPRLTVAAAVALDREIYVFDEPSSGLDFGHMQAITDALRRLAEAGKVVILITHDAELMNAAADSYLDLSDFSAS